MTTEEITNAAIRKGLITPRGKTPVQTMSAVLYRHLNDDAATPVLQRDFRPGRVRAARDSVRWHYVG